MTARSRFSPIALAAIALLAAGCCCDPCGRRTCSPSPCGGAASAASVSVSPASASPASVSMDPLPAAGPDTWDSLLKKYVRGDYVAYADWKKSPEDLARLDAFLAWQGNANPKAMSREDAIAFWINAYNSSNIKMVLDHYPVHSPMDIDGYFDKIKHHVAGEDLTVSQIEYDRLIAGFQDMRAHFTVVCSDRGCLPIKAGAYRGATLDADLEAAARKFTHDPRHLKVDPATKTIEISKIFEWYGPKFTKDPKRPAAKPELFLLPWVDPDVRALLESGDYKLKTIEWNWTLNEKTN